MNTKEYNKRYYQENVVNIKEYRKRNLEKSREYHRKWRLSKGFTPRVVDKYTGMSSLERLRTYRIDVLTYYSGGVPFCACCGEGEIKFLALDHINGDGNKHRKKINQNIMFWIIKNNFPEGFQVLCHNCNMAKGLYKSCPHLDSKK